MFIQKNQRLENLIRNSFVLKSKLTDEQIEKFVNKVQSMDFQTQEKLADEMENEQENLWEIEQNNLRILKKYSDEIFHNAKIIKKWIIEEFEKEDFEVADKDIDEMLKNL